MLGILLFIDVLFLGVWTIFDPLQSVVEYGPLSLNKDDSGYSVRSASRMCISNHTNAWLGIVFGMKVSLFGKGEREQKIYVVVVFLFHPDFFWVLFI